MSMNIYQTEDCKYMYIDIHLPQEIPSTRYA